ncbi:DUF6864 domain-containing function [Chryseolinea sp. T2]|uniref:DUF6864 domain-containing function n=1 Tax=Chryseolinea sp. T2 TaxID=3129255 RepID=UPI0030774D1D
MKRKMGNLEVLVTESILIEADRSVEICLGDADDFVSIFHFVTDASKPEYSNDSSLTNEKTIVFNLYNFIKDTGSGGSKYPMQVGTFQNRKLYLSILVNNFGSGVQALFSYTYYLGEKKQSSAVSGTISLN